MKASAAERTPWTLVNVASRSALLTDLGTHLADGIGFSIATLNLDHAVKLRQNGAFRQAYAAQTHVTADGRPVVWLSTLAGRPVDLITGSDLVEPFASLCADMGVPIALLGSTSDVLDTASERLQALCPTLEVAACLAPPMGFEPDGAAADDIVEALGKSGARVCFLALGAPKQEIFAAHAAATLPNMGFVSVGAGLDFVAGVQQRAPGLVRRFHQPRMKHPAIRGPKMELADESRSVDFLEPRPILRVDSSPVDVETDHIGVLGAGLHGDPGVAAESAAQVKLIRRFLPHLGRQSFEILFAKLFDKCVQVFAAFRVDLRGNSERLPRFGIRRRPGVGILRCICPCTTR